MNWRMIFDISIVLYLFVVLAWQMRTMTKLTALEAILDELYEMVSNDLDDVPPMTIRPIERPINTQGGVPVEVTPEPLSQDKLDELRFGKKTKGQYPAGVHDNERDDYTP